MKTTTIQDKQGRNFIYQKTKKKGYKYEMTYPYKVQLGFKSLFSIHSTFYSLSADGVMTIKPGYCWDGASGPTIDTKNTIRASAVHDVLYQMIREDQLSSPFKIKADKELRRLMLEDGGDLTLWNKFRAGYFYWAVRIFGGLVL